MKSFLLAALAATVKEYKQPSNGPRPVKGIKRNSLSEGPR